MKLAHITPCFAPATAYGGPIESVTGLCRAMARRGHHVRALTTDADGPNILTVAKNTDVIMEPGLSVHYSRRWLAEAKSPHLLSALPSFIKWADVVHLEAVYSFPTLPTLALCRLYGKPLVWSPRGALEHWSGTRRRLEKNVFERMCRELMPDRCVLHVTSDKEAVQSQLHLPRAQSRVVPNGVELPPAAETVGQDGVLRLAYLGRLDIKKGIDNLLDACARLKGNWSKPWRLVIAGFGEPAYERALRGRIVRNGLQERVEMVGPVHGTAKERFFRQADIVVVPSYMENFCMVVAESLAHGVPVIASRGTPWERLQEKDCGVWVDNRPDSLAEAIRSMSGRPLAEMGERGRRWVSAEFTWPKVAEAMERVYEDLRGTA